MPLLQKFFLVGFGIVANCAKTTPDFEYLRNAGHVGENPTIKAPSNKKLGHLEDRSMKIFEIEKNRKFSFSENFWDRKKIIENCMKMKNYEI